jgi:hypothetical protein
LNDATAYRMRAPSTMKDLDAVRIRERVALRRAKGPVGQERAAKTLYKAYAVAFEALQPLAPKGEPAEDVVIALRDTARAYRKLGIAADHHSKRGWKRARSGVAKAEQTLKARVAATA